MFSPFRFARRGCALLSIAFTACALAAHAQEVRISELMAAGQAVIADEDGAFPDWVELHNPGAQAVSLAGWHLSDEAGEPAKWPFPAGTTLAPDGYLVVFASGKSRATSPLHTGFSLRSGGETLTLSRGDGSVADALTFPVQIPDVSFAHDGHFLSQPTPGSANNNAWFLVTAAPQFSQARGFQERPFDLDLTTTTQGATIRYTLDGTEPTENTGTLYTAPIRIAKTTVIRAAAFSSNMVGGLYLAPGFRPSPVATNTYLFTADIVRQSPHGETPKGWPKTWGMNLVDYGMDARVANAPPYKRTIRNDLRDLPSLSIAMPLEDLFDADTGIYANPYNKGREWERAMSMELITTDGTPGFQINGGLRIRGGASRDQSNPKHSFRVLFRKEYGAPELEYPLFGAGGAATCDKFDLRCDQLVSWHYGPTADADFLRDQYGRDTQLALGQPASRGSFFHLYINGQYWGLFNTDERIDADFGARYFGGSADDYDVVKFDAESGFGTGFSDGTFGSWRRLFSAGEQGFRSDAAYFAVQGENPDGSRNRDLERLLDVDSLIDYMLAGFFIGVTDSPPNFGTQNNWYSLRSREDKFGFRFFAHDWELSLYNKEDKVFDDVPPEQPFAELTPENANPWHFFQALRLNAEFRLRFADHAQRSFFNGGVLTPEVAAARFRTRTEEIDRAVVGESARWGDAGQRFGPIFVKRGALGVERGALGVERGALGVKRGALGVERGAAGERELKDAPRATLHAPRQPKDIIIDPNPDPRPGPISGPGGPKPPGGGGTGPKRKPFTRADWLVATQERLLQNYFPERSGIVLGQLRDAGLFPTIGAPEFSQFGGIVPAGAAITLTNPNASGTIYFTLDGSDPREIGGAVSGDARTFATPITFAKSARVKARVLNGETWSALSDAEFQPGVDLSGLRVTEILYHVADPSDADAERDEFIELRNESATPIDLSGFTFSAAINHTFPPGTVIRPGNFVLLVRDLSVFARRHPGYGHTFFAPPVAASVVIIIDPPGDDRQPQIDYLGVFTGKLSDDGEAITLATPAGATALSFNYSDDLPWPVAADGSGFSLVRLSAPGRSGDDDPSNGENWLVSSLPGGTPGDIDQGHLPPPAVLVNEVLTRSASRPGAVELYNPGDQAVDISGWWISDDRLAPKKVQLPDGTSIPARGYLVISASQLEAAPNPVRLSAAGGEVWLFSARADDLIPRAPRGTLTGYVHGFAFGAALPEVPFGRVVTSDGSEEFVAMAEGTLGTENSAPAPQPIEITEIHYAPAPGGDEFVELRNPALAAVDLGGAQLAGLGYTFPNTASIPARGLALVVTSDPVLFRDRYRVPAEVPIFGPAPGSLQDGGERVELRVWTPIPGMVDTGLLALESLRYNDRKPWPVAAAGFGASLQRVKIAGTFAGEPESWLAGAPSPGRENAVNAPPRVTLTSPLDGTTIVPPRTVHFAAEANDRDGIVDHVDFLVDDVLVGSDRSAPFTFDWMPTPGLHDLSARAWDDGKTPAESHFITIDVDAPEGGIGLGLRGEYFANRELEGSPALVRDDAAIDFDWVEVPPAPELARDNFSVRWSGRLLARESGPHTLYVRTFGGVRLAVSGQVLIDQWSDESGSNLNEYSVEVDLTAGVPTEFTLEYFDGDGFAHVELLWSEPGSFNVGTLPQTQMLLPTQDPLALGITTAATLPARKIGRAFSTRLQAVNGTRPYTWSALDPLPGGVTLRADGVLGGTPAEAGIFHLHAVVADTTGAVAQKEITLRITDAAASPFRPIVRIASPQNGARLGDGSVVASGTATAPHGVAAVRYSLNEGIWHLLPGTAQWSVTLDALRGLRAGPNTLRVQATDTDGRESAVVTRTFSRLYARPLTVSIEGAGTVTPGFLGTTARAVGQQYTIDARPAPGFRFAEWRGVFDSRPHLTFTMDEGLSITAVFVPNPFLGAAGTYTGLIGSEVEEHSERGNITLAITKSGALSGVLHFAGQRYALRGAFSLDGFFSQYLPTLGDTSLDVTCRYNFETAQVDVNVGRYFPPDGYVNSIGTAVRAGGFDPAKPHPFSGRWTLALPHAEAPAPQNDGAASFTISPSGRVRLAGKLGDGTPWSTSARLREDSALPLYTPLYERAGSISGELRFTSQRGLRGFGPLFWSRPPKPEDTQYPDGLRAHIDADATPAPPLAP